MTADIAYYSTEFNRGITFGSFFNALHPDKRRR
jgi:hypothetical protein